MSRKVILTKGLPASGKSSWSEDYLKKNPNTKRINKDLLREMFDFSAHSSGKEKQIIAARNLLLESMLAAGFSIIVDDTNLNPIHEEEVRKLVHRFNADHHANVWVEIQDFTDVPLEECLRRDANRAKSVGAKAIRTMYNKWLKPQPPKVEYDPSLPYCVICDLDGTLCLMNGRNPYDASTCDQDLPNEPVVWHVQKLLDMGERVIFVSGRQGTYRAQTQNWLNEHLRGLYETLLMRPADDMRKDWLVKQEIYEREIKGKYNVRYVLDDRQRVVEAWRELGLTVFQVAEGDF